MNRFITNFITTFKYLLLISLLSMSKLAFAGMDKDDSFYVIQRKGEITVAVSLQAPWAMKNKQDQLIGFEIDVASQLARDMGVKVVFREYSWDQMLPALKKGEVDIIASGISITPARALEVSFSSPYASSGYSLVSNLSLTKDFTSIKDLNNEKVFIAAVKGTVSADLTQKIFPFAKLDLRETAKDATSAVVNGSVHAFISSSPVPEFIALKHPREVDLPLKKPLLSTKEAFAIRHGNQQMLNFLNAWITAHTADQWIESSHKYWFNSLNWQDQVKAEK